jgi:hypothetical protein
MLIQHKKFMLNVSSQFVSPSATREYYNRTLRLALNNNIAIYIIYSPHFKIVGLTDTYVIVFLG